MGELSLLFYLGVVFIVSYFAKLLAQRLKIPEVTAYVITGVILGISTLKFLNSKLLEEMRDLPTVALGIIAFLIGIELRGSVIKKLGKAIVSIVIFESLGAFFVVFGIFSFVFNGEIYKALLLGSVAAATAPAATVAVIKQYGAKGPLTTTILAVVGIDDAVALIIYVFASSFSKSIMKGVNVSVWKVVSTALGSIGLSVLIGFALAFVYLFVFRNVRNEDSIEVGLAGFILVILGVCEKLGVSELLAVMVFAAVLSNFSPVLTRRSENVVRKLAPVFLVAFFVFGGAHLNIYLIKDIGLIGLFYFLARSFGKIAGASFGAFLGRASSTIKKYIGLALLPQVGVALALALSIHREFGMGQFGDAGRKMATMIINILLFTTIITEVVGPLLTKFALKKAGEVKSEGD